MTPNQGHNTWKIDPPAGCRFVNEMGGECSLYFPRGREKEVHDSIIKSIHEQYLRATQAPTPVFASSVGSSVPAKNLVPDHAVFNPAQVPAGASPAAPQASGVHVPSIAGLAPHPLDEAIAKSQAEIDHAAAIRAAQADHDLKAILVDAESQATPAVDCPAVHEMNETHYAQCSLAPGHLGLHAVTHAGILYPLNLAPAPVWKSKATGAVGGPTGQTA